MLSVIITILLGVFIIGLVVMIHEFGHFVAAKASGITVEEFSFGFGPKLWGRKKGDTEYMIRLFPIGGYVKILGEETRIKQRGSFSEKPFWRKLIVIIGGVAMNTLLAILLFYVVLGLKGFKYPGLPYYSDYHAWFGVQKVAYAYPVTVTDVLKNSLAAKAGLERGDQILTVDGTPVDHYDALVSELKKHGGQTIQLKMKKIQAGSGTFTKSVLVGNDGKIGIALMEDVKVWEIDYPGNMKFLSGPMHFMNMTQANVFVLGKLINLSVKEKSIAPVSQTVAGPVGLIAIVDIVRKFGGLEGLLDLTAMLNIGLVIMNILPLPALDGGFVVLLSVEAITRKPVPDKIKGWIFGFGMILFFGLAFVIALKDVVQWGIWSSIKGLFIGIGNWFKSLF